MRNILILLVTLPVVIFTGCGLSDSNGNDVSAVTIKITFIDKLQPSEPVNAMGAIMLFDSEGMLLERHPVSSRNFYDEASITFINPDVRAHLAAAVYGEIYDHLAASHVSDIPHMLEACGGFTATSRVCFFGASPLPQSAAGRSCEVVLMVNYLPKGEMMNEFIY